MNLDTLKYYQLKSLCSKNGLDAKGNKQQLIYRLSQAKLDSSELELHVKDTQDFIEGINSEKEDLYPEFTNSHRLEKLDNKLKEVFAPYVSGERYYFNLEDNTVNFEGAPKGLECTTLIDSDQAILMVARRYLQRVFIGGNGLYSRA